MAESQYINGAFYWVLFESKNALCWIVAQYHHRMWYLCGDKNGFYTSYFKEIGERIKHENL